MQLRAHELIVQFPFTAPTGESEKTEEELARLAERRRMQGKKLQEIAAAKRAEKVKVDKHDDSVLESNFMSSLLIWKNHCNNLLSYWN